MSMDLKILFSRPVTCRTNRPLPATFHQICSESEISLLHHPRKKVADLLKKYEKHNAILVGGRFSEYYAFRRGLLRRTRPPFILLDVEWHARHRRQTIQILRTIASILCHRIISFGAEAIQVFCEEEANNYSRFYGIPRDKFVFIPYCVDTNNDEYPIREGKYLFTGGLHDRDYLTLFNAVAGLPVVLRVAAPLSAFRGIAVPHNVQLLGHMSAKAYFNELAGCMAAVLSLNTKDSLRYPGVITYVHAMLMGKAVIVDDPIGARSYITNGTDGLLISPASSGEMRSALRRIVGDAGLRRMLGQNAKEKVKKEFSYTRYFEAIYDLAKRVTERQ